MPDEELRDGSPLCLECGLCCHGVLHDHAVLYDGEPEQAHALGLTVERRRDYLAFSLPCPKIDVTRCTIYEQRLSTCSGYRCRLLYGYQRGKISLADALPIVGKAKDLLARLLPWMAPGQSFRQFSFQSRANLAEAPLPSDEDRAALKDLHLHINMLDLFLDRHFQRKEDSMFAGPGEGTRSHAPSPKSRN